VLSAKRVMDQSLFGAQPGAPLPWGAAPEPAAGDDLRDDLSALAARLVEVEDTLVTIPETLRRLDGARQDDVRALAVHRDDTAHRLDQLIASVDTQRDGARELLAHADAAWRGRFALLLAVAAIALLASIAALVVSAIR
jgi:hypothetical protein